MTEKKEEVKETEAPPEEKAEDKPEVKEEKKEEPTSLLQPTELINQANTAASRIEKANEELKKQLDRQEAMKVEQVLGGETEAGDQQDPAEKAADDAAKKQLEGTGFEDLLFPKKEKKA